MALKLDNNLLAELGLGTLPEEQKKAMLQHIYETLELRVGTDLANQMTDQQLEEFEKFIDEGGDANQAQALQWLESNLPNYKDVVNQVFEALKGEIRQMAPQIMASSSAAPAPQIAQQPQTLPTDYTQPAGQVQMQQNYQQAPQQYQQPYQSAPQPQQYAQPQMPQQPVYGQPPVQQGYAQPQPLQQSQSGQFSAQQPGGQQPYDDAQMYQMPQQPAPGQPQPYQPQQQTPPQYPDQQAA